MKIEKGFKDIGNFINVESADQTDRFNVLFNLNNKKYYKVYNKAKFLYKTLTNTEDGTSGIVYDFLIPFFRKNYTFLPKLHYETEEHLFFEYYIDYSVPKANDFIDSPVLRLNKIFNIPYKEKNLKPTILFKEIVNDFKNMYIKEKVYDPIPADIGKILDSKLNFKANASKLNYLTVTPSNISLLDFVVKRDKYNNIIDWKFVDMEDFTIQPPRYIFNLDNRGYYPYDYTNPDFKYSEEYKIGGDDYINYEQIRDLYANAAAVYHYDKKWHIYHDI